MSKFDALYNRVVREQAVLPPSHREGLQPHVKMISDIVRKQNVTQQPEIINNIMQGITNPAYKGNLEQYGIELSGLVKKISDYISKQPTEHRADYIEHARQTITHPETIK
jgi:hypothetical protein